MSTCLLRRKAPFIDDGNGAPRALSTRFKMGGGTCQGFTMIEVLAVLLVLAVVMTVILSRTPPVEREAYAQAAMLRSHLRFAQALAMSHPASRWGVSLTPEAYTLLENDRPADIPFPNDHAATHRLPDGVRITGGIGEVQFDPWGSPGTETVTITLNTETVTIAGVTGFIP